MEGYTHFSDRPSEAHMNGEQEEKVFDVGDSVFYPMHGVGIVESVEEKDMLGERAKYYILRFITSKLTAMVPVASADSVGLRPVIDSSECEKIFEYLDAAAVCAESENWNQRYRDNLAKLKGGDIYDVADVIKCLKRRDSLKGLSAGDRKMLITARQVLSAELCAQGASAYRGQLRWPQAQQGQAGAGHTQGHAG